MPPRKPWSRVMDGVRAVGGDEPAAGSLKERPVELDQHRNELDCMSEAGRERSGLTSQADSPIPNARDHFLSKSLDFFVARVAPGELTMARRKRLFIRVDLSRPGLKRHIRHFRPLLRRSRRPHRLDGNENGDGCSLPRRNRSRVADQLS